MSIVLLILKIIGITLAVLIGLILLFVILVLLVPIRYRGNAEYPYEGNRIPADGHGVVSWLLHIIHISFDTTSEGQILKVKVFGFTFYTNDPAVEAKKAEKLKKKQEKIKAKKRKKKEKELKRKKKAKQKADAKRKKMQDSQRNKSSVQQDKAFKKWNKEKKKRGDSDSENDSLGSLDRAYFDADAAQKLKDKNVSDQAENNAAITNESTKPRPGSAEYVKAKTDEWNRNEKKKKSEIYKKNLKIFDDEDEEEADDTVSDTDSDDAWNEADEGEKKGKFSKIKEKIKSIVNLPKRIYNKISAISDKVNAGLEFKDDPRVRTAVKFAISKVKLILKRVLPRKLSGNAVIGMDNPATTGYIFGGFCMIYGKWAGHFVLEPDFTGKRLEGNIKFKGKIVLLGVAIPALKLIRNKDFKYLRSRFDDLRKNKKEDTEINE